MRLTSPMLITPLPRLVLAALLAASGALQASDPRQHQVGPDDYFTLSVITGCAVSPDGEQVAYTQQQWEPPHEERNTDLWIVSLKDPKSRRLTFDRAADTSPQWSPDAEYIYYLSNPSRAGEENPPYDGKKQVWRIRPTGTDNQSVTTVPGGVTGYDLSADGKQLFYTTRTNTVANDPWKDLRSSFSKLDYGHGVHPFSVLWCLNLDTWRTERCVDDQRVINEFQVSPDGRWVAMQTTPTEELISNEGWSSIALYDTATRRLVSLPDRLWRDEAPSPYGWLLELAWSSDSRLLSFRCDFDGYPGEIFVASLDDANEWSVQRVTRPGEDTPEPGDEVHPAGMMTWAPDRATLVFNADDHARNRLFAVDHLDGRSPTSRVITPGDAVVSAFDLTPDGKHIVALMSGLDHPPDLFLLSAKNPRRNPVRLTQINPQVDSWKLPQIKLVQWTSPDGTPVEGLLELPPDYVPGKPLPTVIALHGGPTACSYRQFRFWIYGQTLFASRGWALLSPNYRGSTGYGDRFMTDLIGHKNDRDVADILAGVDWLVAQGIADPDRLAVMGWSNGGYLTNCLISRTDRFKAASSGAGVFDIVMQWLTEDTPGHVINYSQGFPWDRTQRMRDASALYNIHQAKTPTLIHVGENDERCPPEHSRGLYRALHHYLDVPCELIVYPGEGHGLTRYTHRKAKMLWDIRWLDQHVLGQGQ